MSGKYVALQLPWYETKIVNCSFCGKMIAGQYWEDASWPEEKFCEPSCADLRRDREGQVQKQITTAHVKEN